MFAIGAFSKLAQLSVRVLRHYDEIGLLVPAHTNPANGYRFYTSVQLADVHRIIALRELGLTLEQVQRVMNDKLGAEAIAGMLRLERIRAEQTRLDAERRLIELDRRLAELGDSGRLSELDLVEKAVPAAPMLSYRATVPDLDAAYVLMNEIVAASTKLDRPGPLIAVAHDAFFDVERVDLEMGYAVAQPETLELGGGRVMTVRELEAIDAITVMYVGDQHEGHRRAHHAIAIWLDAHGCQLAGPGRELVHTTVGASASTIEIQYPISRPGRCSGSR